MDVIDQFVIDDSHHVLAEPPRGADNGRDISLSTHDAQLFIDAAQLGDIFNARFEGEAANHCRFEQRANEIGVSAPAPKITK